MTKLACAVNIFNGIPLSTKQLIVVKSYSKTFAKVYLYQKNNSKWELVNQKPINAVVGKNGVVNPSYKMEGDKKTPKGLYYLGTLFGVKELSFNYPYKLLDSEDKFIDDPKSPEYNTWVSGDTTAQSYEVMLRHDGIYDLGIVINYNMSPIVSGRGSAIFMHIWYGSDIPTIGCVAMSKKDLVQISNWINIKSKPMILIQ